MQDEKSDENKREYISYGPEDLFPRLDCLQGEDTLGVFLKLPKTKHNPQKYKVTIERVEPEYSYFILFKLIGTSVPIVTKSRFWGTEDFLRGLREAEVNIEWCKVIEETKEEERQ